MFLYIRAATRRAQRRIHAWRDRRERAAARTVSRNSLAFSRDAGASS
jgi:hypothetical protein